MLVPATPCSKIRSAAVLTIRSLVACPFFVSRAVGLMRSEYSKNWDEQPRTDLRGLPGRHELWFSGYIREFPRDGLTKLGGEAA
ncbi:hypothetical protein GCM10009789_48640 [Kribbella sancticallisti]|uniref:Uncharacterized protein n=1 Tax=Kribbella sancticallisti TaxID=460087 RepID=A0ABP4PU04_9ACTN